MKKTVKETKKTKKAEGHAYLVSADFETGYMDPVVVFEDPKEAEEFVLSESSGSEQYYVETIPFFRSSK